MFLLKQIWPFTYSNRIKYCNYYHIPNGIITTNVVSSNPAHGEVYSIQHYVIKFVSDIASNLWFSPGTLVSFTNKTDCHDITEILLKVALNTIILILTSQILSSLCLTSQTQILPSLCLTSQTQIESKNYTQLLFVEWHGNQKNK